MTTTDREFGQNEATQKFIMGVANYRGAAKLAKLFVGESFVDSKEALDFIGEIQIFCDLAFRFCLGNEIDPDAVQLLRDMTTTEGFRHIYPQPVADYLNETFEPEWGQPEAEI